MDNLLFIQKNFRESFQGVGSFEKYIKKGRTSPKNCLSVYHNNVTQALRNALALTYPQTWKLIGEDCANGAAYAFVREEKFLPSKGNLEEWGGNFPDFLKQFPPTQSLSYLPDFAMVEWLKHLSYCAKDALPLNAADFKDIAPESCADLVLKLHPSVNLFCSSYSLDQVFAVVEGEVDSIKLDNRKTYVLIVRPYNKVNIHWISHAYFSFFTQFYKGISLIKTLEKIHQDEFQFHEFLSFSLQNGVFSNYIFASE